MRKLSLTESTNRETPDLPIFNDCLPVIGISCDRRHNEGKKTEVGTAFMELRDHEGRKKQIKQSQYTVTKSIMVAE